MSNPKLRYFYEAAVAGSMRTAAEKIGVAASSISRQIAQLESEYGLPLVEKGRRSVRLTEAGKIVLGFYQEGLAHQQRFESQLDDLRMMRVGDVSLAAGESFSGTTFSSLLCRFLEKNPGINLRIRIASTPEILGMIVSDEAHIGLVFHAPKLPRVRLRASVPQPIKVIVCPDHPLASQRLVRLSDLSRYPLCLPEESYRLRQILENARSEEGVSLKPVITSSSMSLTKDLVAAGGLVALLPEIMVVPELRQGKLVAIPTDNPTLQSTSSGLVTRLGRPLPKAAAALLTILEAGMKNGLRGFDTAHA